MSHQQWNSLVLLPFLVKGHEDNIKITRPNDLRLAELFIADQHE